MALQRLRVLIVGCGLSGSAIRHFLAEKGALSRFDLHFWESSDRLGGRFATSYFTDQESGRVAFTDTAAQYLTRFTEDFGFVFDRLEEDRVLIRIPNAHHVIEGMKAEHHALKHYVPPRGYQSVVEHFLTHSYGESASASSAPAKVNLSRRLISLTPSMTDHTVAVVGHESSGNEIRDTFDAVVLTTPVPITKEILSRTNLLHSKVQNWSPDTVDNTVESFLSGTGSYSQRYAFSAFYRLNKHSAIALNSHIANNNGIMVKYDFEDDMIRFVSIENYKQGYGLPLDHESSKVKEFTEGDVMSILLHSSIPYAIDKQQQQTCSSDGTSITNTQQLERVVQEFLNKIHAKYFPFLHKEGHHSFSADKAVLNFWDISQITRPTHSILPTGNHLALLSPNQEGNQVKIILGGDYMRGSNFENCLHVAKGISDRLLSM